MTVVGRYFESADSTDEGSVISNSARFRAIAFSFPKACKKAGSRSEANMPPAPVMRTRDFTLIDFKRGLRIFLVANLVDRMLLPFSRVKLVGEIMHYGILIANVLIGVNNARGH